MMTMRRNPFAGVALCLFVFVTLGSSAGAQYMEDTEIKRLEEETTKKILCQPFEEQQYPPKFLEIVKKIEEQLKNDNGGGVALVGRVRYTDGSRVGPNDLTFNLRAAPPDAHSHNCYPFDDGWFYTYNLEPSPISKRILDEAEAKGRPHGLRLTVLSMDGFPSPTAIFRIKQGKIIYLTFELEKVPPDKRITISGRVCDETGQPLRDSHVSLSLADSTGSGGREPRKETTTDGDGRFTFDAVAPHHYYISAFKEGLAYDGTLASPPKAETDRAVIVPDLVLCKPKKIIVDFVYQPDGSRDFTKGNLKTQTLEMKPDSGYISFKEGKIHREGRDLELWVKQGNLFFHHTYVTNGNGVYDAGEVPFDSVVEAKDGTELYRPDGRTEHGPVKKNHVYVVRTYSGEYAKLIVRDIITIEPKTATDTP